MHIEVCLACLSGTQIVHTQGVKINNILFKHLLGPLNMQVLVKALCVCVFLVSPKQDLGKSMAFQNGLKPLLQRAIESIGVILELSTAFKTMQNNSIFDEILAMSKKVTSAATIGTLRLIDNQHFFWEEGDMSKMLESQISLPSYLALLSPIVVL